MSEASTISPTDLRAYLRASGWTQRDDALKDRLYVMQNPQYSRRQMVFPMDTSAPDYRESVLRVCEKIAEITGEALDTLIGKIRDQKDDVLRLRIFFDGNDSSLPHSFAGVLVQNTAKLLKAAACTALRPRMHHPRLALSEALLLVEKTRFQQTEKGSFVLKVACPINALEVQGGLALDGSNPPFVRQATFAVHQYPVVFFDTLRVKIRADGLVRNKAVYLA